MQNCLPAAADHVLETEEVQRQKFLQIADTMAAVSGPRVSANGTFKTRIFSATLNTVRVPWHEQVQSVLRKCDRHFHVVKDVIANCCVCLFGFSCYRSGETVP